MSFYTVFFFNLPFYGVFFFCERKLDRDTKGAELDRDLEVFEIVWGIVKRNLDVPGRSSLCL